MKVRIVRDKKQKLGEYEVQYSENDITGERWHNIGKYRGGVLFYFDKYEDAKEVYDKFIQNVNDDRTSVIEMTDLGDIN